MSVTRTIAVNDLTPAELAELFTNMNSGEQAEFFAAVWNIARAWPGAGWCQQSYSIALELDRDGREAIETLAAHVVGEPA